MERTNRERFARYEIIKEKEARVEEYLTEDADIIVVLPWRDFRIVRAAVKAAREQGIKAGMVRPITGGRSGQSGGKSAETASRMLCVEMSLGQMVEDVRLAVNGKVPVEF